MPSGYGGVQFWTDGWTGQIQIDEGGAFVNWSAASTDSGLRVVNSLIALAVSSLDSSFAWTVTSAGLISITADVSFTVTMTGTTNDKLGFTSSSYGGATTRTAETVAPGGFYPYTDDDGVFFTLDIPQPSVVGFAGYGRAFWLQTPGTNLSTPILSFSVLRSKSLEFASAVEQLGSPAKLDLYSSSTRTPFYVGQIRTSEQSEISGWTEFEIEVVT